MATNHTSNTFIVWAPYQTDAGALERRRTVRGSHIDNAHRLTDEGIIRAGGVVLASDSADAAPADRKFFGSCMILEAENLEAARKLIENDIFYTEGVWDKEKLEVLPILLANPLPPVQRAHH